jgi:metal-responsive CopG/Arc/MetJ family transcriptional regulator
MVLLFGMTNTTIVSVKIPERILEQIPPAGHGRSGFIVQAIEEKIAKRKPVQWKPKTERGRRMAALLKKGRAERSPLLSDAQVERELNERRGRSF